MVELNQIKDRVEGVMIRKVYGKHSLTVGEVLGIIALIYGVYKYKKTGKKNWLYFGLGATIVAQALF